MHPDKPFFSSVITMLFEHIDHFDDLLAEPAATHSFKVLRVSASRLSPHRDLSDVGVTLSGQLFGQIGPTASIAPATLEFFPRGRCIKLEVTSSAPLDEMALSNDARELIRRYEGARNVQRASSQAAGVADPGHFVQSQRPIARRG